jgi:hypothetical protein
MPSQLEIGREPMTQQSYEPQVDLTALEKDAKQRWVMRMLFGVAVLGAVIVVFVYRDWFQNIARGGSSEAPVSISEPTSELVGHLKPAKSRRTSSKHHAAAVVASPSDAALTLSAGITEASMRSPLAVEVISGGGRHQVVGTRDDAIYLGSHAGLGTGEIKQATEQARVSSGVVELPSPSVGTADPVLAKQQTVEGAVVLLAQIDKDGNIKSLHELSGPEILFGAAREAVKQLHFNPYYQSGQAVETETQITVKFAISAH